jgi:hypothetical protein
MFCFLDEVGGRTLEGAYTTTAQLGAPANQPANGECNNGRRSACWNSLKRALNSLRIR